MVTSYNFKSFFIILPYTFRIKMLWKSRDNVRYRKVCRSCLHTAVRHGWWKSSMRWTEMIVIKLNVCSPGNWPLNNVCTWVYVLLTSHSYLHVLFHLYWHHHFTIHYSFSFSLQPQNPHFPQILPAIDCYRLSRLYFEFCILVGFLFQLILIIIFCCFWSCLID